MQTRVKRQHTTKNILKNNMQKEMQYVNHPCHEHPCIKHPRMGIHGILGSTGCYHRPRVQVLIEAAEIHDDFRFEEVSIRFLGPHPVEYPSRQCLPVGRVLWQ